MVRLALLKYNSQFTVLGAITVSLYLQPRDNNQKPSLIYFHK